MAIVMILTGQNTTNGGWGWFHSHADGGEFHLHDKQTGRAK